MTKDLWYLNSQELGSLMRQHDVSAVEIVQAMLDRIESLEPRLNTYITVTGDEALETARQCDADLASGRDRGPLHGIPVAVKDLYDTAGIRTTCGSKILFDRIPDQDATSVARLRSDGAVILGKTNLNEFAYGFTTENPHYGDTHNPWNVSCIAGGSSGGSAAAVAAGLCTLATGTDTGGSIREPAALCGIVGLKPSYGRISCRGVMPLSWEQDHAGPMARTVYDAALMLEAMAGWDTADPATTDQPVPHYVAKLGRGIEGVRIGVDPQYALHGISAEVRAAFEKALDVLVDLKAKVLDIHIPGIEDGSTASLTILSAGGSAVHEEWLRTRPEDYDPNVLVRLKRGLDVTGAEYARAQRTRRLLMRSFESLFEQVDLLATPMCAIGAPLHGATRVQVDEQEIDVLSAVARYSRPFNLIGVPAISVPCGFTPADLPIGLQLIGPMYGEVTVLQAAHAYEQATDWHLYRPPVDRAE